jgi:hypothetical protein
MVHRARSPIVNTVLITLKTLSRTRTFRNTYTPSISELAENEALFTMANQCLICLKQLDSKAALKNHTGTADPTLRKPHACGKCDRSFCSQGAMEQHRDAPAHPTFSYNVCNKSFGGKQAVADHKKSLRHSAGNIRLHYALSGRECCSNSYITCRPPPRPCLIHLRLIHLRYPSSPSPTTRTTAAPWQVQQR